MVSRIVQKVTAELSAGKDKGKGKGKAGKTDGKGKVKGKGEKIPCIIIGALPEPTEATQLATSATLLSTRTGPRPVL